jgi:Mg-chelatase subunit ChlD
MSALRATPRLIAPPQLAPLAGQRRRLLWLALLIAALLATLACDRQPGPGALAEYHLTGARGPACLRLVIGTDVSGSMNDYATAREAALGDLLRWVPANLRPGDEVAVVDFADDARVRLPPTAVETVGGPPALAAVSGGGTEFRPVLDQLATFPDRPECDTAVVLISDGMLAGLPAAEIAGLQLLAHYNVHDLRLLVPGEDIDVPSMWHAAFPSAPATRFDGHDQDATARAFGETIAGLTGQRLNRG